MLFYHYKDILRQSYAKTDSWHVVSGSRIVVVPFVVGQVQRSPENNRTIDYTTINDSKKMSTLRNA